MGSKENICNDEYGENTTGAGDEKQVKPEVEQKRLLRVLTVFAYLVSVSLPAFVLSSYYIFIWESNHNATHIDPHETH